MEGALSCNPLKDPWVEDVIKQYKIVDTVQAGNYYLLQSQEQRHQVIGQKPRHPELV